MRDKPTELTFTYTQMRLMRQLRDSNGRYLWTPNLGEGHDWFAGIPIYVVDEKAEIGRMRQGA